MNVIYLDHAATTPIDTEVFEKMKPYYLNDFYNPNALYVGGVKVRKDIEQARSLVAEILHAQSSEIYFVDGGTEANNLAIYGVIDAYKKAHPEKKPHVITSSIEHASVYEYLKDTDCEVTFLAVNQQGRVNLKELRESITEDTVLISVAYANGEIGSIEDIKGVAKAVRHYRKHNNSVYPYFHTDAVQAVNYLPINILKLGVDLMTISGSKIYGPKKIAALFVKRGVLIRSFFKGGDQERGLRPGTENVPSIIGFAQALSLSEEYKEQEVLRLTKLKQFFITELMNIDNLVLNTPEDSLPNIVNITIPHLSSEEIVLRLDAKGIYCSMKSACKSGDDGDSHVITSLRKSHTQSLRFSMGRSTQKSDLEKTLTELKNILGILKETKQKYYD